MDQIQINPLRPLPPPKKLNGHESESATYHPFPPPPGRRRRSSKCLVYALLVVVLLSIFLLILARLTLRVKSPTLRLSTAAVSGLRHAPPTLNMTLSTVIVLRNKNFGRFHFRGGNMIVSYQNAIIGTGSIRDGSVGVRERREMNVSVNIGVSYMNFSSSGDGIGSGDSMMRLRSFGEVRGEVRVLGMMNRRRSGVMNCSMDLNLRRWEIEGLLCF